MHITSRAANPDIDSEEGNSAATGTGAAGIALKASIAGATADATAAAGGAAASEKVRNMTGFS